MTILSGVEKLPQCKSGRLIHDDTDVTSGVGKLPLSLILTNGHIGRPKVFNFSFPHTFILLPYKLGSRVTYHFEIVTRY
jgi:hypothetical protein